MPSPRENDLLLLRKTIQSAGELALDYYGQDPHTVKKKDGTPVSEADLAVDDFLRENLMGPRKDYGWLSEESEETGERLTRERVWIVDPIDGTRSFLNGKAEWTVSAALVEKGDPVLAAVFNPVTDEYFEAEAGQGASLNDQSISVSDTGNPGQLVGMVPKAVISRIEKDEELAIVSRKWVSSIAYRICLLSTGAADILMAKIGSGDWDLAAAQLILTEAGGQLTTFDNQQLKFNKTSVKHKNILATNSILHNKLLKVCENLEF